MKFVKVFDYVGHTGLYQVMAYLMLGLFPFFNGLHNISVNFFAGHMDHWCSIPRLENFSFDTQRYVGIPYADDEVYDSCTMYDLEYDELSDEDILTWNRSFSDNASTIECSGWVFDQSEFVSTIDSKVCNYKT